MYVYIYIQYHHFNKIDEYSHAGKNLQGASEATFAFTRKNSTMTKNQINLDLKSIEGASNFFPTSSTNKRHTELIDMEQKQK